MRDILLPESFKGFMTDNQFRQIAIIRKTQVREWKAIPESTRPTWEEFKRGFKVKKVTFNG